MKSNSELEREERKLKNIRWYQILMTIFLVISLIFIILFAITTAKLKAQQKLRGDFDRISLVMKFTQKISTEADNQETEIVSQEKAFEIYDGPYLSKDYYGKSLGSFLNTISAFHFTGRRITGIDFPNGNYQGDWIIFSYSERNVNGDHSVVVGVDDLLLDRVNIFIFQLQIK